jgi:murein DD-endopeptidase MepM/ murein hydrolase activator NlpD
MVTGSFLFTVLFAILPSVETQKAAGIFSRNDYVTALGNPYIVSTVYYTEDFLSLFSPKSRDQHPCRQIISSLKKTMTPEFADGFIWYLKTLTPVATTDLWTKPVGGKGFPLGGIHKDAIDIFVHEGSPVFSMAAGVVVLAEGDWNAKNSLSTSSAKGGNTVIIFNPFREQFIRYCHLATVTVHTRQVVSAGEVVGTVGHTGSNASKNGHGRHLHLEINAWNRSTHHAAPIPKKQLIGLVQ